MAIFGADSFLSLFPVNFQIDDNFLAAVERGDAAHGRLRAFQLGVHLIVGIGVQAAEAVAAVAIGEIAAHGVGAQVFQKDHAVGQGIVRFVADHATHGAELCLFLGILGRGRKDAKRQQGEKENHPTRNIHWEAPVFGGVRSSSLNVRRFWTSAGFASTSCDCSLYFFRRTTTSYSMPSGTRTANSPWELVYRS